MFLFKFVVYISQAQNFFDGVIILFAAGASLLFDFVEEQRENILRIFLGSILRSISPFLKSELERSLAAAALVVIVVIPHRDQALEKETDGLFVSSRLLIRTFEDTQILLACLLSIGIYIC